jgi:mycobactin salicyl-AMP ligase
MLSSQLEGFVPFPPDRASKYRAAGYWAGRGVDSLLSDAAHRWPAHIGVVNADGPQRLTFAELDERADRAAAGLASLGIAAGDRVLLQLPNSCEFAAALFGLLRVGAIPVMCLTGHRAAELGHFAAVSEAVALLIPDSANGFDYRPMAEELTQANPVLRHVIVDGDAGPHTSWSQVCASDAARPEPPNPDPESPALLLVSGGTTGTPKLIPRTHNDYVYNATASAEVCELTADDVYMAALPAAHNFPLACPGLLGAIAVGATTVFLSNPSPESAFAAIARHGVTVTALVPALANLWAQATEWEPEAPTSLRLLQVGGAKLEADDAQRVRETLTPGLQQVFGMAEGLLNYTRPGDPPQVVDHTQGRPLCAGDELRIVNDAGQPVPAGTEGELLVRGPYTFNGYFRAEDANARSFDPEGFYRSGDLVRQHPDGNLEVTGRVKDVIHRGGETIPAADLEEHLRSHPAISSAAAVPLRDPYLGEKICAAVVFSGSPITLAELNAHLDQRGVARHARPDVLTAMTSLPTTPVGKVDKKAIARQLQS